MGYSQVHYSNDFAAQRDNALVLEESRGCKRMIERVLRIKRQVLVFKPRVEQEIRPKNKLSLRRERGRIPPFFRKLSKGACALSLLHKV
jgi:hypothetical protein